MRVNLFNGAKLNSYVPNYQTTEKPKKETEINCTNKKKVDTIGKPKLSQKAQEYYKNLKDKFSNVDFTLVDSSKMNDVKKDPNKFNNTSATVVYIDEKELEKMAAQKEFAEKQENSLNASLEKLPEMKNELDKLGISVDTFGLILTEDKTKFFAQAKASEPKEYKSEAVQEFLDKNKSKILNHHKAQMAEIRKKYEPVKRPSDETIIIKHNDSVTVITDSFMDLTAAFKETGTNYFEKNLETGINIDSLA